MPIVLISSPPHGMGSKLAQNFAEKMDWPVYTREELAEDAHIQGIKLSRLETSIIKSPIISEKLAFEKELYLSFVTDSICRKAVNGNLVYAGRAAHLLLPGFSHLLRVGLGTTMETRVKNVIEKLKLPQEKASDYLISLDEDIKKWVHYVHREESYDLSNFDLFLNLKNMTFENASELLEKTAKLPDFNPSKENLERLEDIHLAARAKLYLARNKETAGINFGIRANKGTITVTYMPRQESVAAKISRALEKLDGCKECLCTMAETNILCIQEEFNPKSEDFENVTSLAKRWGAAVELLRLIPEDDNEGGVVEVAKVADTKSDSIYDGGVEDDGPEISSKDGGLTDTLEELVAMGRSAGGFTLKGGKSEIVNAVKESNRYSIVIMGELFLSKGHQTSTRLTRELGLTINERLKVPVISTSELQSKFLFGKKQAVQLLIFAAIVLCLYGAVFTNQVPILNVLGGDLHESWKWVCSIGVALFVPFVAFTYGTVAGLILKIIDID